MDIIDNKLTPGCRIAITTRNGASFTGLLHSYNEASGKIVLKSVTTAGSKLYGPQHFYRSDLIELQRYNEPTCQDNNKHVPGKSNNQNFRTFASAKTVPVHLSGLEAIDTDELAMANIFRDDHGKDQGFGSGEEGNVSEFEDYYEKDDYILICRVCEKFFEAIVYLMEQKVVSVTFDGVNIGRDGTLSLIQVATETSIIVFDMLRLENQAFDEGLQALFEASNIVKVIHDCRWISDMLLEKYNIRLANIFDTQVANAFVYKIQHKGEWPRYVESLPSCLVKHLNLPLEKVNFIKIRERLSEKDQSVWLQRPLSDNLLSAAKKNVSYLIQLYQVLINKLLYEFRIGVELYQNHVRKQNGEIESSRNQGHLLPYTFLEIPKLVNYNFAGKKDTHYSKSYMKGFQVNCLDITDKQIIFSRDSVWHRSKGRPGMCGKSSQEPEKGSSQEIEKGKSSQELAKGRSSQGLERGRSSQELGKGISSQKLEKGRTRSVNNCRDYNRNNANNSNMSRGGDSCNSYVKDVKISGNNGTELNKDKLQNSFSYHEDESNGVNHQMPDNLFSYTERNGSKGMSPRSAGSATNQSNTESKDHSCQIVSNSYVKNMELDDVERKKSNLDFLVRTGTEKLIDSACASNTDQPKNAMNFSEYPLTTNGIKISQQHTENLVLPMNINKLSEQPLNDICSDSLYKSKLWQAFHAKESHKKPELLCDLNASTDHSDQNELFTSSEPECDLGQVKVSKNGMTFRGTLKNLDSSHAVRSEKKGSSDKNSGSNERSRSPHSTRSSNFSSDTESTLTLHALNVMDLIQDKSLHRLSVTPAGHWEVSTSKRKLWNVLKKFELSDNHEFNDAILSQTSPPEDDICNIPMHCALKRQQETPLGVSFDICNPFPDTEYSSQQSENTKLFLEPPAAIDGGSIFQGTDPENVHLSQVFQKTVKVAASTLSSNLRHKLLPPKTSPSSLSLRSNKQ